MARELFDKRLTGANCRFAVVVIAIARDSRRVNFFRYGIIDRELDPAKWGSLDTDSESCEVPFPKVEFGP